MSEIQIIQATFGGYFIVFYIVMWLIVGCIATRHRATRN